MTALSDAILNDNAGVLDEMLTHPFVLAIANGSLPDAAYHRYLVYEGAFVETAISIFAYATAKAPDLEAKHKLVEVQRALVRDQIPYFEKSYQSLCVAQDIALPDAVRAFDRGMLKIAEQGDFIEIVTAMFAAEWMYWTWCKAAAAQPIPTPHVREWIDLHAAPEFEAQARWLKGSIDRYAVPADLSRLCAVFKRVTELEIAFHHAPLREYVGEIHA